jgi:hypothetical protein
LKNRTAPEIEQAVVEIAIEQPAWGQVRVSEMLKRQGLSISPAERLAKFGLLLHEDKTWLIMFGKFAAKERARQGLRRPETFDFLGFSVLQAHTERSSSWTDQSCG